MTLQKEKVIYFLLFSCSKLTKRYVKSLGKIILHFYSSNFPLLIYLNSLQRNKLIKKLFFNFIIWPKIINIIIVEISNLLKLKNSQTICKKLLSNLISLKHGLNSTLLYHQLIRKRQNKVYGQIQLLKGNPK